MTDKKVRVLPFLYILFFCIWQYTVNDMATSTNAYQAQSDRTSVYIYLIAILTLLSAHLLSRGVIEFVPTTLPLFVLTIWTFLDNAILGNIFGSTNMWSSLTQIGLCAWWFLAISFGYNYIVEFEEPEGYIEDHEKEEQIVFFIIILLAYYCYEFIRIVISNSRASDQTIILNLIYRIIVFTPFSLLIQRKWLRNGILVTISVLTVISFKRGAIIILPIMFLVWYFVENRGKQLDSQQIIKIVFVLLFVLILFYFADKKTDGFLSYRFSSQQLRYGSSRDVKYATVISEISQRNLETLFLGIGSSHRGGVHNEVLEFIYTYGVIGLAIYLWYFASMFKRFRDLLQIGSRYASVYGMCFVYIFIVGIYSGVVFSHSTFYMMLLIGILERKIASEEIN